MGIKSILERNPVIPAIKDNITLEKALNSNSELVFIIVSSIINIKDYTDKLKKVFLAHVSKDSNNISLIKETLEDEFIGMIRKPNCEITTQDNVTKLFDIDK